MLAGICSLYSTCCLYSSVAFQYLTVQNEGYQCKHPRAFWNIGYYLRRNAGIKIEDCSSIFRSKLRENFFHWSPQTEQYAGSWQDQLEPVFREFLPGSDQGQVPSLIRIISPKTLLAVHSVQILFSVWYLRLVLATVWPPSFTRLAGQATSCYIQPPYDHNMPDKGSLFWGKKIRVYFARFRLMLAQILIHS